LLGLPFTRLSEFYTEGFDVVINATPIGSQGDALPFAVDHLNRDTIVVDLVYVPGITALVAAARTRGLKVVEGREVLLAQVERQFACMTGRAPPTGLMADMLGLTLTPSAH
jgi:shikimate 5-dehydrogenase